MKKSIILLLLGGSTLFTFARQADSVLRSVNAIRDTTTGIHFFVGTWEQALAVAGKENKLLFVDCYSSWCPPCAHLAKDVFPKKEIGDYFNAHFINVKINMGKEEGKELRKRYAVEAYPTLLLLNPHGYEIGQLIGGRVEDTLIKWAGAIGSRSGQVTLDERFDRGERTAAFLQEYFTYLLGDGLLIRARELLAGIIREQGFDVLYERKYFGLLPVMDMDSPAAVFFTDHYKRFAEIFGADVVHARIVAMYTTYDRLAALMQPVPIRKVNEAAYRVCLAKIAARKLPEPGFVTAAINFYVACKTSQFDRANIIAEKALKAGGDFRYYTLAKIADWALTDRQKRDEAAAWAAKAAACTKSGVIKRNSLQLQADLENMVYFKPPYLYPSVVGIDLDGDSLGETDRAGQMTGGIRFFEGSWEQALQKAQQEHKLIFLDCSTSWCGPCKELARTVFPRERLGAWFNAHFINVSMDMEKGDGITLRGHLDVNSYPTLFLLNERGYPVQDWIGAGDATEDSLLTWAAQGLVHRDSVSSLERYEQGDRDDSFIRAYGAAFVADHNYARIDSLLRRLVAEKGEDVLLQPTCYDLIPYLEVETPEARFLVSARSRFAALYGEDQVDIRIAEMYLARGRLLRTLYGPGPLRAFQADAYQGFIKDFSDRGLPAPEFMKQALDFFVACQARQYEKACQLGTAAVARGNGWQCYIMASLANRYLSRPYRAPAAGWAQKAHDQLSDTTLKSRCVLIAGQLTGLSAPPPWPVKVVRGLTYYD